MSIADAMEEPSEMEILLVEAAAKRSETYWLLEWPAQPEFARPNAEWLGLGSRGMPTESIAYEEWTTDASKAIRFCRKQDALAAKELIWRGMHSTVIATEHMDVSL